MNSKPMAYLSINKNRVKIYKNWRVANNTYDRAVFFSDGTQFEVELDNPTKKTWLAKIKLNGKYISNSGIVLRPGEHVYLERYLDNKNRFRFETYSVPEENVEATVDNGLVAVEFFEEETSWGPGSITITDPWTDGISPSPSPYEYPPSVPSTPSNPWKWTDWNEGSGEYSGSLQGTYTSSSSTLRSSSRSSDGDFETGRVEKGGVSNQQLTKVNKTFKPFTSYTTEIKILANSHKPVQKQDIKLYCTNCGTRFKSSWNFCSKCGSKRP